MADSDSNRHPLPTLKYMKLTWPAPYVAHIEINRPEKLNAFTEPYAKPSPWKKVSDLYFLSIYFLKVVSHIIHALRKSNSDPPDDTLR